MLKNTIEMGWLTWDKNKMMLAGPPVMWNMVSLKPTDSLHVIKPGYNRD